MSTYINKNQFTRITYYYYELYQNYEQKKPSEISDELGINIKVIRRYIECYCPSEETDVNKLGLIILLCTKFREPSPYIPLQNKYKELIEKRKMIKLLKEKIHKHNKQMTKNKTMY